MEYELKVITPDGKNKVVKWDGTNGVNACQRYADCFPGHTVYAWRDVQHGIFLGLWPIID